MALIRCNGCGGQVSDRAKVCPHCGVPIAIAPLNPPQKTTTITGFERIILIVSSLLLAVICIFFIIQALLYTPPSDNFFKEDAIAAMVKSVLPYIPSFYREDFIFGHELPIPYGLIIIIQFLCLAASTLVLNKDKQFTIVIWILFVLQWLMQAHLMLGGSFGYILVVERIVGVMLIPSTIYLMLALSHQGKMRIALFVIAVGSLVDLVFRGAFFINGGFEGYVGLFMNNAFYLAYAILAIGWVMLAISQSTLELK